MLKVNSLVIACLCLTSCVGYHLTRDSQPTPTPTSTDEPYLAPTPPRAAEFITRSTSNDYHTGSLRYLTALTRYRQRLDEYMEQLVIAEGLQNLYGKPCLLPYGWTAITLPQTPDPVSTDPIVVSRLLATHVRLLRDIIIAKNREYAPCVK